MTANSTKTRKEKGRKFQQKIASDIRETFNLPDEDVVSVGMGASGADIRLSNQARNCFPYSIEAKHCETLRMFVWMIQAEKNTLPLTQPLLVFRKNPTKNTGINFVLYSYAVWNKIHRNLEGTNPISGEMINRDVMKAYLGLKEPVQKPGIHSYKVIIVTPLNRAGRLKENKYVLFKWEDFLILEKKCNELGI